MWDETKVINGEIGKFAAIARRSGDDWFIGIINDRTPRELKVPLAFLDPGKKYEAHIYSDDESVATRTHVAIVTREVSSQTILDVPLRAAGGEAIWITPFMGK